jgi:hypothetical protein
MTARPGCVSGEAGRPGDRTPRPEASVTQSDFYDVLDEFDACMLLTFTADGRPHARPMTIARRDGSSLWFLGERDSAKVDEVVAQGTAVITSRTRGGGRPPRGPRPWSTTAARSIRCGRHR